MKHPQDDHKRAEDGLPDAKEAQPSAGHVFRVLYVCTGNTCRSPMAEGILRKLVAASPIAGVEMVAGSAGTLGLSGAPATDLAMAVASEYGVDLSAHRSRALTPQLLSESDLVFALAAEHYDACRRMGMPEQTLFMLRSYPDHSSDRVSDSIPDPIGASRARYEEAFFQIDEAIRRSFSSLQSAAAQRTADTE